MGKRTKKDIASKLNPTKFQEAVYTIVRTIPKGKVTTYKAIANQLGTGAYRAVGTALKNNPDIPQTPCHRVINSNGDVGAYAGVGGTKRKAELLKKEGVEIRNGTINLSEYNYSSFSAKCS
jgi:methylated-DNA-[protein]-cysteine S-methyltransferase